MRGGCFGARHVTQFFEGRGSLKRCASSPLRLSEMFAKRSLQNDWHLVHTAATPAAQPDALHPAVRGKLDEVENSAKKRRDQSDFRDTLSVAAGWTVIALGLAMSLHASRCMIAGHEHGFMRKERENLPVSSDQLLDEA